MGDLNFTNQSTEFTSASEGSVYSIGQLAKMAGVGVETIRFYQRRKLLRTPETAGRGFRKYIAADLAAILRIKDLQSLGFSLKEIQNLLKMADEKDRDCGQIKYSFSKKASELREKIERLRRIENQVKAYSVGCAGECTDECQTKALLKGNICRREPKEIV